MAGKTKKKVSGAKKTTRAKKKPARKRAARTRAVKPHVDEGLISLKAPDWMAEDERARAKYEELAPELLESGVVLKVHENALVIYCEEWVKERDICKTIREDGVILESPATGNLYSHPAENVRKMYLNEMARQLKIMGLEVEQLKKAGKTSAPKSPGGPSSFLK